MTTIYVLGAGFSKTCGIATDLEMLDALNPLLEKTENKNGVENTYIEALLDQNYPGPEKIGFEVFMSTISALKYSPEYLKIEPNKFLEAEQEIRGALIQYLKNVVKKVDWQHEGKFILDFVTRVNWQQDAIITFNYDLLLETAMKRIGHSAGDRILHLHGAINDKTLAWPTYRKFAYRNTRSRLAERWRQAYNLLSTSKRNRRLEKLIFIGYSMPMFDLEARGLFNYTDWYNHNFYEDAQANRLISSVPKDQLYNYQIIVVNPCQTVKGNYKFLRKDPVFYPQLFSDWLNSLPT